MSQSNTDQLDVRCSCHRRASAHNITLSRTKQPGARSGLSTSLSASTYTQSLSQSTSMVCRCLNCRQCTEEEHSHHEHLQAAAHRVSSYRRTRPLSQSAVSCQSRSVRTYSSKLLILSPLIKHLKVFSFLALLFVCVLDNVPLASARPIHHQQHQQQQQESSSYELPERCTLPFSYYGCGGFQDLRYTYRNGSCRSVIEWSGPGCEYDGTENSFATQEECESVCLPPVTTTASPTGDLNSPMLFPPLGGQSSTPTAHSQTQGPPDRTDAAIAPIDTSVCFVSVEDFLCFTISFPTTYYTYQQETSSCQSIVSFCTIDRPGVFETREACLNACERPLNPVPVPVTTTELESEPDTTTPCPPSTTTTQFEPVTSQGSGTTREIPMTTTTTTSEATSEEEVVSMTTTEQSEHMTTTSASHTTTSLENKAPPTTSVESRLTTDAREVHLTTSDEPMDGDLNKSPSFLLLNKFDLASLVLGLVAMALIAVLVVVVMFSVYRRHARLRRQKQEVMDSKKSEVRTLAFTLSRHEKSVQQTTKHSSNTSMSTTSSTISSYLTTV